MNARSIEKMVTPLRNGLVVPRNDAYACAEAITVLIHNPGKRGDLSRAARETVGDYFDVTVCEGAIHDRLTTLLAGQGKRR